MCTHAAKLNIPTRMVKNKHDPLPLRRSNFLMTAANFPCRRCLTLFTEDPT